jgi:site-specific DNA recombinase
MRERFFEPGAFAAFCDGFTAELTLRRREHLAELAAARSQLAAAERRQKEIMESLIAGYRCDAWKAELLMLDERKAELAALLTAPPLPALHPKMADAFREKATTLAAGLEHDDERDVARLALRGFLEKIVIPPGDELLQVVGNAGAMLAAAAGRAVNSVAIAGCGGDLNPRPLGYEPVPRGEGQQPLPTEPNEIGLPQRPSSD